MKFVRRFFRRIVQRFFLFLRKIQLPGLQGVGLYDVLRFFFQGLFDPKFTLMAAAMAYNFFFSLFPLLLLLFTLVPRINSKEFQVELENSVMAIIPEASLDMVMGIIDSMREIRVEFIVLNVFLTLYGAMRGIIAMMKAFTKKEPSQTIFKRRNIIQLYSTAFVIMSILFVMFTVAIALLVFGEYGISYLRLEGYLGRWFYLAMQKVLRYAMTLIMLFFSVSVIYYLAPATHQRWKFFSPGTLVAGVLLLMTLIGLNYFFSNLGSFNQIYGSLGAAIVLMLWFYYISIILLIGFELNAAIDLASFHRTGKMRLSREREKLSPWRKKKVYTD